MTNAYIKTLIRELTCKKEKLDEDYQTARDEMYELEGQRGELQLVIWRLEEMA